MTPFIDAAAKRILELHECVAAWIRKDTDAPPVEMGKFLAQFHPEFVMIAPAGRKQGREALVRSILDAVDSQSELDINIVDLDLVHSTDDIAIFTYEEQRHTAHAFQRRRQPARHLASPHAVRGRTGRS